MLKLVKPNLKNNTVKVNKILKLKHSITKSHCLTSTDLVEIKFVF